MWRVLGNLLCDLGSYNVYFLVYVSPKPLNVATSKFADDKVT